LPNPPNKIRPGSSPAFAPVVEKDLTLYGADRQSRADSPERRTQNGLGPRLPGSPPIPELEVTKRPPDPWGRTKRAPAAQGAAPAARPGAWSNGYNAEAPPTVPPVSEAPGAVHGPRRKGEIERDRRAEAEAKQGTFPPSIVESQKPPSPKPKATAVEPPPTPAAWRAALFKLLVAAGAFLTAATAYLSLRTAAVEPKVEAQEVRVKAAESTQETLVDRVAKLEGYIRAERKRTQCVEAQLRDALARGTGHVLTTLPATPTPWSEQNAPKNEPRLYWRTPTWFTTEGCDAAPAAP
jgi:hypothetical protein